MGIVVKGEVGFHRTHKSHVSRETMSKKVIILLFTISNIEH